ncbi:MAG: L-rhamnose mutarotase [Labilibaculum antarcticum]
MKVIKKNIKKRHSELWPELKQLPKEVGISEHSIFLDEETNTLFAFKMLSINGYLQYSGQT